MPRRLIVGLILEPPEGHSNRFDAHLHPGPGIACKRDVRGAVVRICLANCQNPAIERKSLVSAFDRAAECTPQDDRISRLAWFD